MLKGTSLATALLFNCTCALALNSLPAPHPPTFFVEKGQYLSIEYDIHPTLSFDLFTIDGGRDSIGVIGTRYELYHDDELLSSYTSDWPDNTAFFTSNAAPLSWQTSQADLSRLGTPGANRIELHPIFNSLPGWGYSQYWITNFQASSISSTTTFSVVAEAVITKATIASEVPEPSAMHTLLIGLSLLAASRLAHRFNALGCTARSTQ